VHPTPRVWRRSWQRREKPSLAGATKKVLEVLRSGLPASESIVLLSGEDEYLHDLVIKKLEALHIEPDFRDFNFRRIDCNRSSQAGPLAGHLSELPTLVDNRMVVLQRVSQLTKPVAARLAEIWKDSLAPGTILVVTAGGSLKDNALWKSLSAGGQMVDCRLTDKEVDVLLKSFCKRQKKKVASDVFLVLRERVGLNLRGLLSHLERCLLSLQPDEVLNRDHIERLVPFSADVAMWKMTKAIGQRDHNEALAILDNQLDRGEQPGSILGYLNSYLVSLVQVGGLMKTHKSAAEVARVLPRKTEFQVKKSLAELRTWSEKDFEQGFDALTRADFKNKGGDGGADPRLMLQMLVLKLCSRKRSKAR
jgi:DNA polymerase III subunit delta